MMGDWLELQVMRVDFTIGVPEFRNCTGDSILDIRDNGCPVPLDLNRKAVYFSDRQSSGVFIDVEN